MTQTGRVPWLRIVAEAVAIVASILLAFAIDAAWANRQEAAREEAVLQGLLADFVGSRDELVRIIGIHERSHRDFTAYLATTPEEMRRWPRDSTVSIQVLAPSYTFDPRTATLDGLQSAGELGLVGDHRLQGALADWSKRLADLDEDAADMLDGAGRVTRLTEHHGGPFVDLPFLKAAGPLELSNMRADVTLMGAARTAHYNAWYYLAELRQLLAAMDEVIGMLEAEVQ